jgi:hypothetical protein
MVEVLAEAPGPDRFVQILAGGPDHPDIHGLAAGAAQAAHLLFLDDLQELRLQRPGQEPDLVQEDRAAMRGLEEPGLRLTRVGEGPALPAEQLGLQERLGNSRAVDVDEGAPRARAGAVDRPRHEPLARTGLPQDEDGRRASRGVGLAREHARDLLSQGGHPRALADQRGDRRHGGHLTNAGSTSVREHCPNCQEPLDVRHPPTPSSVSSVRRKSP